MSAFFLTIGKPVLNTPNKYKSRRIPHVLWSLISSVGPAVTRVAQSIVVAYALVATPLVVAEGNGQIDFSACKQDYATPGDAECGSLSVPENPKNPEGRQITLNIMRVPAVSRVAKDPLFIVVGGPGGSAVKSAAQYLPYFRRVQQKRDIIFVDQRGTGGSNGLKCPLEQGHFSPLDDQQRHQQTRQHAAACVQSLDAQLEFYTTPYAVGDLEQVRRALGYQMINMWGVSYGTRVILEYMRTYSHALRAAVLDGTAPVSIQLPEFAEADGSRALALILDQCEAESACASAFGNLRSRWLALLTALDAKPQNIDLVHPRSQDVIPTHVSPAILSSWTQLALYSRELAPLLPQAMARAVEGDFSVLGGIGLLAAEDIGEHVSQGMQATVLCAEDRHYARSSGGASTRQGSEQARLLWLDRAALFDELCEYFPRDVLPASYFSPLQSDVPTLLVSGTYDPITPPRWAERVASGLTNGHHLVVRGGHHGVSMQGCMPRVIEQFIEAGTPDAVAMECAQLIEPRPFFIDGAGPAMAAERGVGEAVDD